MKRLLLLLILSIFWTLAGTQISLPAASVQPDAAPVAPVGASAADTAATQTVIVADPAVDSLSDPAPNAAEPVVRMTLDECMAYAVEHSPVVRQQDYTNRNYRQDYIESVAALVPSVSGSVSATTSFGRSVDPETNTYTDVSNLSNNYGVSGQMPVFAGFTGINTIRAAKVMRLMGVEELQRVKDEVALNTMQAYFDVVYYAEQEAQCASDDYLLTQQENNLELARITLAETMNYPPDRPLGIETDLAIETPAGTAPFSDVVAYALDNNPKARSAGYNVRQSKLQYSVARGGFFPSVYVGGGYSTNFFMSLDDHSLYEPFKNQFRDNRGYYFSAQLNIPIFGGLSRRTRTNRARNNWRIAEQQRDQTLRALQSEIAQNYQQMLGYGKEFVQASKKSAASELAYNAVAGKYDRGMVSALDLQTAANNLLQARSERLRARLQYIIKTRLVEYYNGAPLIR